MQIPDEILESFGKLIADLIGTKTGVLDLLCFDEKHKEDIYISAPAFLIEAYQNYLLPKTAKIEANSLLRFMGIKMVPSFDYAVTLYHKDYVVYKQDWMIRKMPLMPGLEAYCKENEAEYKPKILPFVPGDIVDGDPSLN